jgi:hypothetical protein
MLLSSLLYFLKVVDTVDTVFFLGYYSSGQLLCFVGQDQLSTCTCQVHSHGHIVNVFSIELS